MRLPLIVSVFALLIATSVDALPPQSDPISNVAVTATTGEKPQSKVWKHDDRWWSVLPNSSGTQVRRLDGTTWTDILQISSSSSSKADVKVMGDVVHILLYQGTSSELVSLEYLSASATYQPWSSRPTAASITLDSGVEIATIDIDSDGRMWLASDGSTTILVRYSDPPFSAWSSPVTLASGVSTDDISVVIALPDSTVGVLWSNQSTERFGFRVHIDGADPTVWAADEVPASQSVLPVGGGMADDHLNVAVASDATLYAAVKTSYDTAGYPKIALLIRRPNGGWDDLYEVDQSGTRGIVLLNEMTGTVSVIYTASEGLNNIVYRESQTDSIAIGARSTLISGTYNDVTSTKQNISNDAVILASTTSQATGVYVSSPAGPAPTMTVISPNGGETWTAGTTRTITWSAYDDVAVTSVDLDYSTDSGGSWSSIVTGLANSGSYAWAVPNTPSMQARVKATAHDADLNTGSDESDADFTIQEAGSGGDLVGWWAMEEGSGTVLVDSSGTGNHGDLHGAPGWVAGVDGLALDLDGAADYALVPDDPTLDITDAITVAAWIRPEKQATQYLVKKATQSGTNGYELSLSSAGTGKAFARFNQASSGNDYRIDALSDYPKDGTTWQHLAVTYDGSIIRLYVDGVEEATLPASISIATNSLPLGIGAQSDGASLFQGAMDDVRVYDRALDAGEIAALAGVGGGDPVVTLTSPNGGELWTVGSEQSITWIATDDVGVTGIDLEYSTDSGGSWFSIAAGLANTGSFAWTIPNTPTTQARVRVTAHDGDMNMGSDESAADFTIQEASSGGDLVGWWPMEEGSGAVIVDSSGHGNDGNLQGAPGWVSGVHGLALDLDGASDYASVPDDATLDIADAITVAAWIRPEKQATQYLVKKATQSGTDGYELSLSTTGTGKPFARFNQATSGNAYRVDALSDYPKDGLTWMHLAVTYDGATMRLYVDGTEEATLPATITIATNDLPLAIGAQSDGGSKFQGAMDDVRVYDRALDAGEIAALANVPGGAPEVTLTSPNGGEVWPVSSMQNITWLATDDVGVIAIDLEYSTDGGGMWSTITTGIANTGSYAWNIPGDPTTLARVRVTAHDADLNSASDVSDANFFIQATGGGGDLVGWWLMDEGGGSVVVDSSGLGNHGAIQGAPVWVAGVHGLALDLNGSTDHALIPDNATLDIGAAITLAAWIRPEAGGTEYIVKKANISVTDGYEISLSTLGVPFVRFNQQTSGNLYRVNGVTPYPTDGTTWMHVAATYDGVTMRLYVDGVEDSSKAETFAIATNELPLAIGAQSDGTRLFNGAIDDARVYGYALDAAEIAVLADRVAPEVTLTSPTGGEVWTAGTVEDIIWAATDNTGVTGVALAYSNDGGSSWIPIATGLANSGSYSWTVPEDPTVTARVRVTAIDGATNETSDSSAADFEIASSTVAIHTTPAPVLSLSSARPNPFSGRTTIHYTLPRQARMRLEVFDLGGRRIRSLAAGIKEPGEHSVIWDGRTEAGMEASSGLYFLRLETGGEVRVRKALITR